MHPTTIPKLVKTSYYICFSISECIHPSGFLYASSKRILKRPKNPILTLTLKAKVPLSWYRPGFVPIVFPTHVKHMSDKEDVIFGVCLCGFRLCQGKVKASGDVICQS